jgi:hypothetical protein
MRQDTINKEIREDFTDADKIEMGAALAEKLVAIQAVEAEKKSADSVFNERRKVLESEVESLATRYNKGYEMAVVGCDIRYNDPAPGQKSYYRMDTAQLVETLEMSWEEKQEELQFNIPPAVQPTKEEVSAELDKMMATGELPPEPRITEVPPSDPPEAA